MMSPKSGLKPMIIARPSEFAIIHPPPDFLLDLLPSDAMIRRVFCWINSSNDSALSGSLKFLISVCFHFGSDLI